MSKGIEIVVVSLLGVILGTVIGIEITVFEIKNQLKEAPHLRADCFTMLALTQVIQNREKELGKPPRPILSKEIVDRCSSYGVDIPGESTR